MSDLPQCMGEGISLFAATCGVVECWVADVALEQTSDDADVISTRSVNAPLVVIKGLDALTDYV